MKFMFVCLFILGVGCAQESTLPSQEAGPAAEPTLAQEMSAQPTDGQLFEEGRRLQARADFKGAESRYRQAIAVAPSNPQHTPFIWALFYMRPAGMEKRAVFLRKLFDSSQTMQHPVSHLENSYTT